MAADDTISFVVNANANLNADETALRGTIALVKSTGGFSTWADSWTAPVCPTRRPAAIPTTTASATCWNTSSAATRGCPARPILPSKAIVGTDLVLSYKRSDASEADTTQTGQWSTNLTDWTDIAPVLVNENDSCPGSMEIRIPLTNAVGGKLFGRLQCDQTLICPPWKDPKWHGPGPCHGLAGGVLVFASRLAISSCCHVEPSEQVQFPQSCGESCLRKPQRH